MRKLIFSVLIQQETLEEFSRKEKAREDKYIASVAPHAPHGRGSEEQRRRDYRASRPILRFNNLAGFAEVYWDYGARILVDIYFRGDRRTRYGERLDQRGIEIHPDQYYLYFLMAEIARVHPQDDPHTKRQAILQALDHVEAAAQEVLCFVDTTDERAIVQALDVDIFFTSQG